MAVLRRLPGKLLTKIARRLRWQSDLVAMAEAMGGPISPPVPRPPVPWLIVHAQFVADLPPGMASKATFLCLNCRGQTFVMHRHGLEHQLQVNDEFNGRRMLGTYQGG